MSAVCATLARMYENEDELADLQRLLDASFATASHHLRSIMTEPRRLRAERLVTELDGVCVSTIGTVTARGEPRVSAVDGHFLHGRWYFSTDGSSPKARQLAARPAISLAYTPRDGFGVFAHGRARRLTPGSDEFTRLLEHWVVMYGASFDTLGDDIACYGVDAEWLVGFALTDAEMVEVEQMEQARKERRAQAAR